MEPLKHLRRLLRNKKVLLMEEMRKDLEGRSRISVFRDLKELDYCSSYSNAGKYYTLREVANFDDDGLWRYREIGFSNYGTLKETVFHLVENSKAGYQHEELRQLLQVRVHNTLLELVKAKRLKRLGREKLYLYVSGNAQRAREQYKKREELSQTTSVSAKVIIEILAEVIRGNRICVEVAELAERLRERGVPVAEQQVAQVLGLYGVKKTLGS